MVFSLSVVLTDQPKNLAGVILLRVCRQCKCGVSIWPSGIAVPHFAVVVFA